MKLCALVVGWCQCMRREAILAMEDGMRESTQSWCEVLLNLKSRGMNSPRLVIGDGAMGFWASLEDVYENTRQQRCWMHKRTFDLSFNTYEPKYPKATIRLHKDWSELMEFYDFPTQRRKSIRTTNLTESAFATIRHR